MSWEFLSYELSENLSGYGNGDRIKISKVRQMCCGDTSNNTEFSMPTHFGTHLDFPFHFDKEGATASEYKSEDFIFKSVLFYDYPLLARENKLFEPSDFDLEENFEIEAIIIKSHYCEYRETEKYWKNGPGFNKGVATHLKKIFPNLRLIGFDSISLTNFQNRELGRVVHKEFLKDHKILILEDLDLTGLNEKSKISEMIVSPIRLKDGDGAPATVFAKVDHD